MTNPDYTAICLLVDRSGSMSAIKEDAEGGINTFVQAQTEVDGKCTIRLVQFDTEYDVVYESTPVANVKPYILEPRGMTALLDAWGKAITEFGEELAALSEDERPDMVIFAVVTDGHENSSREWTRQQVFDLVTKQTNEWNWQFLFLAANQDAVAEGAKYGVAKGNAMTYQATGEGTQQAYAAMTASVVGSRSAGSYQSLQEDEDDQPSPGTSS